MAAWYDRDDYWETWAPYMFSAVRLQSAATEVDRIIQLLELAPGASVLDFCCGVGRHSLEFARRGYAVSGVDRTHAYLERARAQASAEGLKVEFIQSDARSFSRPATFDAAVSMFTSFGYFEDPGDDFKILQILHTALRGGGRLLIDLNGKEVIARKFRDREWHQHDDGTLGLEERKVRNGWECIDSRWILIGPGGKTWEGTITIRLYSGVELTTLLKRAGFSMVQLYGNLNGASYDDSAERLIAVAAK
ncbi:MAG: class I SAM-dependent methyltransferase [Deltaproteobacteria bacterium]|nr:class I SAM-dependent methyltransferase [Deltaproteobacteria bacterium]